jgi:hypothetical protein
MTMYMNVGMDVDMDTDTNVGKDMDTASETDMKICPGTVKHFNVQKRMYMRH